MKILQSVKLWLEKAYSEWNNKAKLEQVKIFVGVFTGAVTVFTAFNAAWVYIDRQRNASEISRRNDLSTDASYGEYKKKYLTFVQPAIANFLYQFEITYPETTDQKINEKERKPKITILFLSPNKIKERFEITYPETTDQKINEKERKPKITILFLSPNEIPSRSKLRGI